MTIDYLTGMEHQGELGLVQSDNGARGIDRFLSNSAQISYPSGRTGLCLRVAEDGVSATRIIFGNAGASQKRGYVMFIRVSAAPGANSEMFTTTNDAGNTRGVVVRVNTSGQITMQASSGASGSQVTGPTISDGAWHRLEWWADTSVTSQTVKWRVDGSAQTDATVAGGTVDDVVRINIGSSTAAHNLTVDVDDLMSYTAGDTEYPFASDYAIKMLTPTGDGTHANTSGHIENQAGTNIGGGTTAFDLVDAVPPEGAPPSAYVRQINTDTDDYAEVTFSDAAENNIVAVMGETWCGGLAGGSQNGTSRVVDSGGTTLSDIYSGNHTDTATRSAARIVTPPGGGWTKADLNGCMVRIGFSTNANGTNGPRWSTIVLEYAYTPEVTTRKLRVVTSPQRW